ncbi:MAG: diguanylate cyclase [Oscillospiraceae bacterium]|jgi:diguanylate cyclase (GGDEF)-like protein|nr:diguanylate cyclase [Oscillospiraceae bacterium]
MNVDELPESFQDLGLGLVYYCECVNEMRTLAAEMSKGNLDCKLPPPDNEMAAQLKSLHASLRHLSWQAREVARGDYKQRVDFMGEFSESFNTMIAQLRRHHESLIEEIKEVKDQNEELTGVAYFDALTGLFNRAYGMHTLQEWLANGRSFTICFIDMDNLKYVNDKYGHNEGDRYILAVAKALQSFPGDTVVCRLGGDEFMILAPGIDEATAEKMLNDIRNKVIQVSDAPDIPYYTSLSYGVIMTKPKETREASELLSIADAKMYEFKRNAKMERKN